MSGGWVMTQGMLLPNGFLYLQQLDRHANGKTHKKLLSKKVKLLMDNMLHENNYYFQPDSAPIHKCKTVMI